MEERNLTILFTSVGRRVELLQAFHAAAQKRNINLTIVGADYSDTAPALFVCDKTYQVCKIAEPNYIPTLIQICKKEKVDLLIPTIDTDLLLLSQNKNKFADTKVLISAEDKIKVCRDKRYTADFFHKCGLLSPDPVDRIEDYMGEFPCFIKPKDGSSSINAFKVNSKEELKEYAARIPDYIIQPFIEGHEYTVDILCDFEGNPIYIVPRERLAVRAGEVLKTQMVDEPQVVCECRKLIHEYKPCGPLAVQFIRKENTMEDYYIEINPRFGGGAPLSMKAGADMAEKLLLLLLGEKIEFQKYPVRIGETYSRFDQSVCISLGERTAEADNCISELLDLEKYCANADVVIFDLDDTLYSEKEYVRSGYQKIAALFPQIEDAYEQLCRFFANGAAAIDAFLEANSLDKEDWKNKCLDIYRNQIPEIEVYPGVYSLLERLSMQGKRLGIITDGRPTGQRNKIAKLQLDSFMQEIIVTDELAGKGNVARFRKPNTIAFEIMKDRMNTEYDRMIYIGDNKRKDFIAPKKLGMKTLWFNNVDGIYK